MSKKFGVPPKGGAPLHLRYLDTAENVGRIKTSLELAQEKPKVVGKGALEYRKKIDSRLQELCEKASWLCVYCDRPLTEKNATIDHVVPISRGGKKTSELNMVACCAACNNEKGDRIVDIEWTPPNMRVAPIDERSIKRLPPATGRDTRMTTPREPSLDEVLHSLRKEVNK